MALYIKYVFLLEIYLNQYEFVLIRRTKINNNNLIIFNGFFLGNILKFIVNWII